MPISQAMQVAPIPSLHAAAAAACELPAAAVEGSCCSAVSLPLHSQPMLHIVSTSGTEYANVFDSHGLAKC